MTSTIDPTHPQDGIPVSKAEARINWAAAKAELEHGGFAEGLTPANYAAADSQVTSHLSGIDAAFGSKVDVGPADHAVLAMWRGTQAEYDGLGSYDAQTLYVIV